MKKPDHDEQGRPLDALRSNRDRRSLLERVLDTPGIAQIVPELRPEMLHRVIQTIGLEDCADLVALATPQQLMGVFDLDLWRGDPGFDERLDAGRFGMWLEVLMEAGPQIAAQKLAGLDVDLVVAGLAQHIAVFDRSAVGPFTTTDGMEITPRREHKSNVSWEVGGYLLEGKQTDWWDTIVDLLMFLHEEHHDFFNRVMRGCRTLSNSAPEIDGLHDLLTDREQDLFDLALGREQRRGKKGYVPPAEAQAFLQMSRQFRMAGDALPSPNPIARACFQAIEPPPLDAPAANEPDTRLDRVAAFVDMLVGAGVVPDQPRALLNASPDDVDNRTVLETQLQQLYELDSAAYATRTEEFAFLANTLIAGCSLQGRPFTPREASDAATAICNLGLENWPGLSSQFLSNHDLVSAFQMGWSVLYREVCIHTAESLLKTLAGLRCRDREIQAEINRLRIELAKHLRDGRPWHAREALDTLLSLDMPTWAALLGLIAECPVMHAAVGASLETQTHAISPSAFAFIGHKTQVMEIDKFLRILPARLTG
jgi:hypothetical protein